MQAERASGQRYCLWMTQGVHGMVDVVNGGYWAFHGNGRYLCKPALSRPRSGSSQPGAAGAVAAATAGHTSATRLCLPNPLLTGGSVMPAAWATLLASRTTSSA